jgi:hypothetical protein
VSKSIFTNPLTCNVRSKLPSAANAETDNAQIRAKMLNAAMTLINLFMIFSILPASYFHCAILKIGQKEGHGYFPCPACCNDSVA